jgi:hypothetical protein
MSRNFNIFICRSNGTTLFKTPFQNKELACIVGSTRVQNFYFHAVLTPINPEILANSQKLV